MEKERKPDIDNADEAVEKHVDEMLNPAMPDAPASSKASKAAPKPGGKKISVFHDADEETSTAPPIPEVKADATPPKVPLKIAITAHTDEPVAAETPTETPEPETVDEDPPLPPTAPEVTEPVESEEPEKIEAPEETAVPPIEEAELPAQPETEEATPAEPEKIDDQPAEPDVAAEEFSDENISKAVDDIVATESDKLLAAEDEKLAGATVAKPKPSVGASVGDFFGGWWHNPITRWLTILLIVGTIAAGGIMPATRYYALNTAGVRSSASVQIIDQSTLQPLKDVQVQLAGQTSQTDSEGKARFSQLKLGQADLVIQKPAFAAITQHVVVGWGSNPLGSRNLAPIGSQYSFLITDYLSGKPLSKVAASANAADAQSDDKGKIKLTLEHSDAANVEVKISAAGYRTEKLTLDLKSKQQIAVRMVPARKAVFISKRSGKYDVYKVDIDGKNEQLVLAGTGSERDDMVLAPHPTDEVVALISTRDNKRNADGYLLSTLTLIDLGDNTAKTVTSSEQLKLVNWVGDRLVYVQVAAGASAANPNRQRLISYDYKNADNRQLTATNYFNDVMMANGKIYYAPSSTYQTSSSLANFYAVNADGTYKQTLLQGETWNAFRTAYDRIVLSLPGQWYELKLGGDTPVKLEGQPASLASHTYVDSPDGKHSLWVDSRDGKGVLLEYDVATKTDKTLRTQSGLSQPLRWLGNNIIMYRIHTDQETADYALSLDGGEPQKVRDVTSTGGVDSWYYY